MFYINIDASDLQSLEDIEEVVTTEARKAVADLTAMTHGKVVELAAEKLHTRRSMYLDGLSQFQIDDNTWCVNLDAKVRWIDDGMPEHSMLEALLRGKNVKHAKDGSAYVTVPFQLNKPKQALTPAQQSLLATVKKALATVGATPNKIEFDSQGAPKLGLVRSVDIEKAPISTGALRIGTGPRGQVAQGPTGIPLLRGVKVFQHDMGGGKIGRTVMTFRTASEKHAGQGRRWVHPGNAPTNIMDEAERWAREQWEKMVPQLLAKIKAGLK